MPPSRLWNDNCRRLHYQYGLVHRSVYTYHIRDGHEISPEYVLAPVNLVPVDPFRNRVDLCPELLERRMALVVISQQRISVCPQGCAAVIGVCDDLVQHLAALIRERVTCPGQRLKFTMWQVRIGPLELIIPVIIYNSIPGGGLHVC